MNTTSPFAIDARAVTRRYGTCTALEGIDLSIERGRITALLGPNGAGKTTFVHLALGRGRPDAGVLRTLDAEPGSAAARARSGVMLQSAALVGQLTVREHFTLHSGYYRDPLGVDELLARTGLLPLAGRRYSALSGGQQRRVQFGVAICGRPELLVLDEPTVALDADSRRHCWSQVREQADAGAAVLLTTHLLDEAEALADRVVLLAAGRIIADGTPHAIRAQVSEQRIRCRTELPLERLESLPCVVRATLAAGRADIRSSHAETTLRDLIAADPAVAELEVARATLEQALDQLIHREAA
jgi:ABC-2 type transport system ATP-binding protein